MKGRVVLGVLLASFGAFYCYLISAFVIDGHWVLLDDAAITARYAYNLTEGHGLVWNPLEEHPVQGYTSPAWMLYMTFWHLFLPQKLAGFPVLATGALCLLWTGWLSWKNESYVGAVAVMALYPLVFWALRGMETGIQVALVVACLGTKNKRASYVLGALACFTRLDSLPFVLVAGLRNRLAAVGGLIGSGMYVAWSLVFHGTMFPNSYLLKLGCSLADRVPVGFEIFMGHSLIPALAVLAACLYTRAWLGCLLLAGGVAYSVYAGGDFAEMEVAAPNRMMLLGFVPAIVEGFKGNRVGLGGPAVLAALVIGVAGWAAWLGKEAPLWPNDKLRFERAMILKEQPISRIAAHGIGHRGYWTGKTVIDCLGRVDGVVAAGPMAAKKYRSGHCKWNYDHSIKEMKPEVIDDMWPALGQWLQENGKEEG